MSDLFAILSDAFTARVTLSAKVVAWANDFALDLSN